MIWTFSDQCFLDAATAIDNALVDHVLTNLGELKPAEAVDIYERLACTLTYHAVAVAVSLASSPAEGRGIAAQIVSRQPHVVGAGFERALRLGHEARKLRENPPIVIL
ncbi:hypothetical protein [Rhizorhabdus sp.]|uniref:hypothetical protein n=1 Tax=Rhizorhabdus sp. TaxID=1968843 RepID=UPI0035B3421E